jgi:hypothetical protein
MSQTNVQNAVAANAVVGVPGDAYDDGPHDYVTKIASEVIPFGTWVSFNTEGTADLPDSTGEVTGIYGGGVAMRDPNLPTANGGYQIGDAVRVCVRGRVFVLGELTLAVTDTPFVRFATGTGTQLGAFRNAADTATCVAAPNTRFVKGGGTTQPPVLEIR